MHWITNFENGKSPCRVNQAAVAVGQFIYSFGGFCQQTTVNDLRFYSPIDVHVLNTLTLKWHSRPRPKLKDQQYLLTPYFRYGHTCVTYNGKIYLWGGRAEWTNVLCNNLFVYKPNKHIWAKITASGNFPDGRDGHTATVIDGQDTMLIFGGYVQSVKKFSNDIYEYNFKTQIWTLIVPKSTIRPHWRDFHTASSLDKKLYVFGGRMDVGQETFTGESFYSNDLYAFDTQRKIWIEIKPNRIQSGDGSKNDKSPSGRRSHSAVVYKRKIIIFGGFEENSNKHFNELYEFNIDTSEWKICSGVHGLAPSPRRRHSCCVVNDRMYIFGGTGPSVPSNVRNQQLVQAAQPVFPNINLLESNLNQINELNTFNTTTFGQVFTVENEINTNGSENNPSNFLNNPDNNNNNLAANNVDYNLQTHHNLTNRVQSLINQLQPQHIYLENNQARLVVDGNEVLEINENTSNIANRHGNNDNYVVEDVSEEQIFENEDDFLDSGEEDLIDEDTDDDFEELDLESLSDLHILDLEVSSLRNLTMIKIIKNRVNYDSLPIHLINELDSLTHVEKFG